MKSATYTGNVMVAEIRRDGGTQIRAAIDEGTVADYTDALKAGTDLPPVKVFNDGAVFWLSDGFHRVEAHLRCGKRRIMADVKPGTLRDAILDACGANAEHGLRRSNADKRHAIETLLGDPEWMQWSDRAIAKHAKVDHGTVAAVRAELAKSPLEATEDSPSGQPTSAHPPAENPVGEDDEGAGAMERLERPAAPTPDEPIPHTVVVARDRLVNVERMLRDAQAEIAPLLIRGEALAVQVALSEALEVVRRAMQPPPAALSPDAAVEAAQSLLAERLVTPSGAREVATRGWPEPPRNAAPAMPLSVNGRTLRPGWAPCKGGVNDVAHVPYLDPSSGDCSRCGRALFVVGGEETRELVIERDEDAPF